MSNTVKANRNTWWVTRPKRSLAAAPGALRELANAVSGSAWRGDGQTVQRTYEQSLEASQLKANRAKRDPNGGGPRTYVAWLKSLGLLWEGDDKKLLEVCNGSDTRVGMIWVSRLANGGKVCSHEVDEHAVVGHLQQSLAINLENSCFV